MSQHLDRLSFKAKEPSVPLEISSSVPGGGLSSMGDPEGSKP